jgi:hypothetical protein
MRSPAAAIGWEFWRRHRWGFAAVAGYLVVLAAIKLVIVEWGLPFDVDTAERFSLAVVVPAGSASMYLFALFSFGFSGDLAARRSIYPARMFTVPVTSAALAGWPMLYGGAALAIMWAVMRLFGPWPAGVAVPVVWPALMAAVLLAWTQALMWMPYGLTGLRVIVALLWLVTIDTVVWLALYFKAREPVILAILAPQLPLAYLAARQRRLRRGSSGGGMAARYLCWSASCCRSSWHCCSPPATRWHSSSSSCSACCSRHRSWPSSRLRRCARRIPAAAIAMV